MYTPLLYSTHNPSFDEAGSILDDMKVAQKIKLDWLDLTLGIHDGQPLVVAVNTALIFLCSSRQIRGHVVGSTEWVYAIDSKDLAYLRDPAPSVTHLSGFTVTAGSDNWGRKYVAVTLSWRSGLTLLFRQNAGGAWSGPLAFPLVDADIVPVGAHAARVCEACTEDTALLIAELEADQANGAAR